MLMPAIAAPRGREMSSGASAWRHAGNCEDHVGDALHE
jgi:hypothetical protein